MNNNPGTNKTVNGITGSRRNQWIWDVFIIVILLIGAYFRFTGINWDAGYHLHPDERFLTMVESAISPVDNLSQYFDTSTSTLNPNNRGYTFYVYGTFPIFIVRYVGELVGMTGYDNIHLVGRVVSGAFDLGTILFVFLIGRKLYKNSKLGLLAALFSALAVLQIQLSHYFTVDIVANFFAYAAIYTAICIFMSERRITSLPDEEGGSILSWKQLLFTRADVGKHLLFGLLFGLALASKVSIFALAFLLPIASMIFYSKLPKESRQGEAKFIIRNLVLAGIVALLTFRIFQPYAFLGPGFFGVKINPGWIASLKELAVISKGDVDVPYALQWARRPITFAFSNLVQWGLGLSLGILGSFGFLWMGWRMFKGDWQKHLLIWSWVAYVFLTQSINWVRSMRYLLPLYPALCLIAAWAVFKLWDNGAGAVRKITTFHFNWRRIVAVTAVLLTIAGTGIWATAFTSIYTRPVTRVAASEWIFDNISSAIEMPITKSDGNQVKQLLAYQNTALVSAAQPYVYGFTAEKDTLISSITLEHVLYNIANNPNAVSVPESISLQINIRETQENGGKILSSNLFQSNFLQVSDSRGEPAVVNAGSIIRLVPGNKYEMEISVLEDNVVLKLDGGVWITYQEGNDGVRQYLPPPAYRLSSTYPFQFTFIPQVSGTVNKIRLNRAVDLLNLGENQTLSVSIRDLSQNGQIFGTGQIIATFSKESDPRGEEYWIDFQSPVVLDASGIYVMKFILEEGDGVLAFYNDASAIESSWDDALPLSMYGYDLFGYEAGLFGNIRNMELYYDDTQTKKDTLYTILDQTDVISISSNRQWGTTVRVPERYPLTTEYYRALIGCPDDKDILWCYQVAEPGMFNSELGFTLTAVFQSDPEFLGFKINDQSAEEAFTVYDHPKVLIFEKTESYDASKMRQVLDSIDISTAVHMTPGQASRYQGNLLLDDQEKSQQQNGGTWSELFPPESVLNTKPWLAAVVWYLSITLLGFICYPVVRVIFKGLPDHGYPLSRLVGMVLLAFFTWLAGSTLFSFSKLTIGIVFGLLVLLGGCFSYLQRKALTDELKTNWKYFVKVEVFMLALFLIDLGIRFGNPDLWHPWKGGEKPMDLSYFTAVLKSSTFPPYDPWYAGGYINYYYFGFVLVGVPVKFLGIMPAVAYNLILPTLFALTGMGAFSVGWNLFSRKHINTANSIEAQSANTMRSTLAGMLSIFTVLIMGNMGTIRMIWQGLQRLAAPGGLIDNGSLIDRTIWLFQGLGKFFTGSRLPFAIGEWYWNPSRALPGEAITEFPFFTFTYADLHAHMIDLAITILVIAWGLSILLGKWKWENDTRVKPWINLLITLTFGGVIIGMLKVTNTWDFPTYLVLSCLIILYTMIRHAEVPKWLLPNKPDWIRKSAYIGSIIVLLVGLTLVFYLPFSKNYAQAYGSISLWTGDNSPLSSYLVHWGLQLFILATWFIWETREWLANTPASSLQKLKPFAGYLQIIAILFGLALVLITVFGVKIGWLAGLLGGWALVLMLRPGQSDAKRLVLFMTGTALVLTLFVEMFVLVGDIGRMNTVFKFYYQAWTFFGLSSAAALVWLIPVVTTRWRVSISSIWQVILALLVFGAALYPITAATDKIRDRMSAETPAGLNGLEFMNTSTYYDQNADLNLNQDYAGILWMQKNVKGSPVLVEANTVEYRWGNRFTIYTGLPSVLGWNWHQRQQRGAIDSNGIYNRLSEIPVFYNTTEIQSALDFINQYDVNYIILGQMERAYYPGQGLDKFEQYDGVYWNEVFREQDLVIYEVIKG